MPQLGSVWRFTTKLLSRSSAVAPPKFEEVVKAVIATLAVFTGVAMKDYITTGGITGHRWWAFVALVSLLLRYIIGSAVHLTYTYARKETDLNGEPNSASIFLLAKDFGFVVCFGVFAVLMAETHDIDFFWFHAKCFLAAGFAWSVIDCACRYIRAGLPGGEHEWPKRPFWLVWAVLDAVQFALTWYVPDICPLHHVEILAVIYAIFLVIDLKMMARTLQVTP